MEMMEDIRKEEAVWNGIQELRAAVVRQACDDYYLMLKEPGRKVCWGYDKKRNRKKQDDIQSLARFFRSKWFTFWCKSMDGETIMNQIAANHAAGFKYHTVDEPEKKGA